VTAGGEILSCRAAPVTDLQRATATKALSCLSVTFRIKLSFSE
jgi:hypothetical protein